MTLSEEVDLTFNIIHLISAFGGGAVAGAFGRYLLHLLIHHKRKSK